MLYMAMDFSGRLRMIKLNLCILKYCTIQNMSGTVFCAKAKREKIRACSQILERAREPRLREGKARIDASLLVDIRARPRTMFARRQSETKTGGYTHAVYME